MRRVGGDRRRVAPAVPVRGGEGSRAVGQSRVSGAQGVGGGGGREAVLDDNRVGVLQETLVLRGEGDEELLPQEQVVRVPQLVLSLQLLDLGTHTIDTDGLASLLPLKG